MVAQSQKSQTVISELCEKIKTLEAELEQKLNDSSSNLGLPNDDEIPGSPFSTSRTNSPVRVGSPYEPPQVLTAFIEFLLLTLTSDVVFEDACRC